MALFDEKKVIESVFFECNMTSRTCLSLTDEMKH